MPDPFDPCALEAPVLASLAAASLTGDLLSHAQSCVICREGVAVWSCLDAVAASESEFPLPSPHLIWWKAQLAQQRRLAQRSVTVIRVFQKLALALALLGFSLCIASIGLHLSMPAMYLWALLALVGLSVVTAVSFLYSDRHTSHR